MKAKTIKLTLRKKKDSEKVNSAYLIEIIDRMF
jgi:hypothetical protein